MTDGQNRPTQNQQIVGYNSSDAGGRILVYDSYWIWRDPLVLTHEALHFYLDDTGMALNMTTVQQDEWIDSHAIYC